MSPNEYQELAAKTICDQHGPKTRMMDLPQLIHAVIGIAGESGEMASAIEKWIWYAQKLDKTNIYEELGDLLWYIAEACTALDTTIEQIMVMNILKLQKRYPEKYTYHDAAEENRDREGEREILEQTGQGWEEFPEVDERIVSDKRHDFDVARHIVDTYVGNSKDAKIAMSFVTEAERRCSAENSK